MNDHPEHIDHRDDPDGDLDLPGRFDRVVEGLHAPDVLPRVLSAGRRRRTRQRVVAGVGSIAAVTTLVLAGNAVAGGGPSDGVPVASDPAATGSSAASTSPSPRASATADGCEAAPGADAWWQESQGEIADQLAEDLPDGVALGSIRRGFDGAAGLWAGTLSQGSDVDYLQFELLPPPGIRGALVPLQAALDQTTQGGACAVPNNPAQAVRPCEELADRASACEEIRDEQGELVGVVTLATNDSGNGHSDTAVRATRAVEGGGYVQLYVASGTPADRPDSVRDPADLPALTLEEARAIVSDPAWTD